MIMKNSSETRTAANPVRTRLGVIHVELPAFDPLNAASLGRMTIERSVRTTKDAWAVRWNGLRLARRALRWRRSHSTEALVEPGTQGGLVEAEWNGRSVWDDEPLTSSRTPSWVTNHTFTLDEALYVTGASAEALREDVLAWVALDEDQENQGCCGDGAVCSWMEKQLVRNRVFRQNRAGTGVCVKIVFAEPYPLMACPACGGRPRHSVALWPRSISFPGAWVLNASGWTRLGDLNTPIELSVTTGVTAGALVRTADEAWTALGRRGLG